MFSTNAIDMARERAGFLPLAAMLERFAANVTIIDPFSTLIGKDVELAGGIVLWPGTTLQTLDGGRISVGENTHLHTGTRLVANGGRIAIGANAEIGEEGGFTFRTDGAANTILVGDCARLLGGGSATFENTIGRGAQVLGPIRMQNCVLDDGGSHREPDPDARGGVLKGSGVARKLHVPTGMVIQAFGLFAEAPLLSQSHFHPKAKA